MVGIYCNHKTRANQNRVVIQLLQLLRPPLVTARQLPLLLILAQAPKVPKLLLRPQLQQMLQTTKTTITKKTPMISALSTAPNFVVMLSSDLKNKFKGIIMASTKLSNKYPRGLQLMEVIRANVFCWLGHRTGFYDMVIVHWLCTLDISS
jgi:hypothetical protein